ncbi:MAG TPA: phenylalanine--tRNA ligase subunit beta [Candidatus Paceibacterota bacterium]|nr:phenylalanine--tRNA ligase subunit beta [Candidatus Paceibacterota bacterium]
MKVSLKWLQTYFDAPLPSSETIVDAYTFHVFEIEESLGDMLDVKVLPNRAADCLSHRGLAKELAAILDRPLKNDPIRDPLPEFQKTEALTVGIEDPKKCLRYIGALVKGVKIGSSPAWLKEALESVGQRPINNVVDATNYVMLNIGQPLHAFDAGKLTQKDGRYAISVRAAKADEKFTALSGEEFALNPNILLITDANAGNAIGIAGIKGGKAAEITADTTDLVIESANFDGTTVRRGAQALKLFTEASIRFQNRPSSELAAYGMRDVLELIKKIAGGEVAGIVDKYPTHSASNQEVSASLIKMNGVLGSDFSKKEVGDVFKRLGLETVIAGDTFVITPPFERTDLIIPEDLAEEVGRIIGYDRVPVAELMAIVGIPDQARFRGIERIKDQLVEQGFTEVSTQSFVPTGDVLLANPLDKNKPALRTSLEDNLNDALARAKRYAPLVLAPNQKPKLFEVGTVFPKEREFVELRMTERVPELSDIAGISDNLSIAELEDYGKDYVPKQYKLGAYKSFSVYPFIVRDIALWAPIGTEAPFIERIIHANAGEFLVQLDQFDRFEKEGKVSLAFRLIFQSTERTLTDDEINGIMVQVSGVLAKTGYEVR